MPKLKKGAPRVGRYVRGNDRKDGAGWHIGQQAKQAKSEMADAVNTRSTAAPAAAEPGPTEQQEPSAPPLAAAKASAGAARQRKKRDKSGPPERRKLAKLIAALPNHLGSTAAGRHSAFAKRKRGEDVAARLAQYHARKAALHIKKLLKKERVAEAAAALGGLVRDPDVRLLNSAAGVVLSEEALLDTQMVDNLRGLVSEAWRTGLRHRAGIRQTRRAPSSFRASSCCTRALRWTRRSFRRVGRRSSSAMRSARAPLCCRRPTTPPPWKS